MWVLRRVAGDPKRPIRAWNVIGRLRRGVTLDEARAETSAIWPAIQSETVPAGFTPREQEEMRSQQVRVESGSGGFSTLRDRYANSLVVLVVFTLLLLTIACVNLSGLLLARAAAGEQQLAICCALGATRTRLAQQVVLESLMLSAAGAAAALPLAWWTTRSIGAVLNDLHVLHMGSPKRLESSISDGYQGRIVSSLIRLSKELGKSGRDAV